MPLREFTKQYNLLKVDSLPNPDQIVIATDYETHYEVVVALQQEARKSKPIQFKKKSELYHFLHKVQVNCIDQDNLLN